MTDIVEIHAVTEYYRCAFRPNDPELTVDQVNEFIEYMQLFYCGEEAIILMTSLSLRFAVV